MKSYKSFTGQQGGLAVLPTLEERGEGGLASRSSGSSGSLDQLGSTPAASYPADLLGVSWGSYLYSKPPSRGEAEGQIDEGTAEEEEEEMGAVSSLNQRSRPDRIPEMESQISQHSSLLNKPALQAANEPHPLLQHLEGLMTALRRSKAELIRCGLDVSPLIPLCNAATASHGELKELMAALSRTGSECNTAVITSDLVHNLVEYLRAVLQGLVAQGKKLNVQVAFLQQAAREMNKSQRDSLKEQREIQEAIDASKSQLDLEREDLNKQRRSIHEAKLELKQMLQEAEEKLSQSVSHTAKKKGRMDSPHTIAQGRSQLAALTKTQNQQSRLEKTLIRQQREIRSLQQAHDITKSGLLAVQDHVMKLQRKLARQIQEVTATTQGAKQDVPPAAVGFPAMERKSYKDTSRAQVKATLKGIITAQKTLTSEIQQMQRQISEQHMTGERLSRQLEDSCQRLLETDARLKSHTASMRGRPHRPSRTKHTATEILDKKDELVLPKLTQTETSVRKTARSEGVVLPQIQHPSIKAARKTSRRERLPNYQFSKSELFTLARFEDHETAEQVMSWLQSQGKLQK